MPKHYKNKSKKKKAKKNMFIALIFCFSITIFIVSVYSIINWIIDNISSNKLIDEINEDTNIEEIYDYNEDELINQPLSQTDAYWEFVKMPLISINFDGLLKRNKDTVGWINVNNTNINYPVVQSTNNSYYLTKDFDGNTNRAGWIFADYRNNMKSFDKNTIIYGHNRLNQIMFGSLKNVLEKNWYEDKNNHIIRFSTPTENTMWQVFTIYKIPLDTYYLTTSFANDEAYQTFLDTIKSRSIYDFNVPLSTSDKILTLSTCSNTSDSGRIVIQAKLIKCQIR